MVLAPKSERNATAGIASRLLQLMVPTDLVRFGQPPEAAPPSCYFITIPPVSIATLMVLQPTYWIPEAYCRGYWALQNGDLADFLTLTQDAAPASFRRYMSLVQSPYSIGHVLKQKLFTKYFSRLVRSHYEISPEIYRCFLDDEMVYTCAFFEGDEGLSTAQDRKFSTILNRLSLPRSPEILNIGCGWGSFERFVARAMHSARITGLSISESQVAWAKERNSTSLNADQLSRINLLTEDFTHHRGIASYDAVTAIGMAEHVGQSGYPEFFRRCHQFLRPNGTLLVHMIIKPDSNVPTNSWIDRYIFPGGYSPSISELTRGAEGLGFRVKNIHIHHPQNYARTLREWRNRLHSNRERIFSLYDLNPTDSRRTSEYMFRQWEFYLAGSEAAFRVKGDPLQVAQFVFEKSQ